VFRTKWQQEAEWPSAEGKRQDYKIFDIEKQKKKAKMELLKETQGRKGKTSSPKERQINGIIGEPEKKYH